MIKVAFFKYGYRFFLLLIAVLSLLDSGCEKKETKIVEEKVTNDVTIQPVEKKSLHVVVPVVYDLFDDLQAKFKRA